MGVDVSDAMMAEAARNCRECGLANVAFVKSDDRLSRLEGTFDLIHSAIVFQHIAGRRVELLVRGLLAHLARGGVGALHFTTWLPLRKRVVHRLKKVLPPVNIAANIYRGELGTSAGSRCTAFRSIALSGSCTRLGSNRYTRIGPDFTAAPTTTRAR